MRASTIRRLRAYHRLGDTCEAMAPASFAMAYPADLSIGVMTDCESVLVLMLVLAMSDSATASRGLRKQCIIPRAACVACYHSLSRDRKKGVSSNIWSIVRCSLQATRVDCTCIHVFHGPYGAGTLLVAVKCASPLTK